MSAKAEAILHDLAIVDAERDRRQADAHLAAQVLAVKSYQQDRFRRTYADLLASVEYGGAARFFLEELYGPRDFSDRDAQFARVVPAVVRLFGVEIVDTVASLAALHALSEALDTRLAVALTGPPNVASYPVAWRLAGTPAQREQQITLTLRVGRDLDRLTRKPLVRHSLRLMRGPAAAAGLSTLQSFLESGFDTFRAMRQPVHFLETIAARERSFSQALFEPTGREASPVFGQLP